MSPMAGFCQEAGRMSAKYSAVAERISEALPTSGLRRGGGSSRDGLLKGP